MMVPIETGFEAVRKYVLLTLTIEQLGLNHCVLELTVLNHDLNKYSTGISSYRHIRPIVISDSFVDHNGELFFYDFVSVETFAFH